jgi:uncharacterized membrane protein
MLSLALQVIGWALTIFWIWMVIDCVRNEDEKEERTSWFIVLMLMNIFIAPIYYFRAYRPRQIEKKDSNPGG